MICEAVAPSDLGGERCINTATHIHRSIFAPGHIAYYCEEHLCMMCDLIDFPHS